MRNLIFGHLSAEKEMKNYAAFSFDFIAVKMRHISCVALDICRYSAGLLSVICAVARLFDGRHSFDLSIEFRWLTIRKRFPLHFCCVFLLLLAE